MSGASDRLDDPERGTARQRARDQLDAATDDMEWEIERGQLESRYAP